MILKLSKLPKSLEPIEVKLNECLGLGKKIAKKKEVELFHVRQKIKWYIFILGPSSSKILEDWEQDLKCRKLIEDFLIKGDVRNNNSYWKIKDCELLLEDEWVWVNKY